MISLKHRFAFRLATTSFIYPADYATNVRRLSPRVDEVELLFYESHSDSLPSKKEMYQLATMAADLDLSYNVHLPLDLDFSAPQEGKRHGVVHRMADIIKQVAMLSPTTFTLHLNCSHASQEAENILDWQERTKTAVKDLLGLCRIDAGQISIETLHYPPHWFAPIVKKLDLAVCLDVGHILRYGYDLEQVIDDYADRISILHLHGVTKGEDHRSLIWLDQRSREILIPFLTNFSGSVSIEVFSADKLDTSLIEFERMMSV
jgi:sugar phosphate isomerase/epimerase